MDYLPTLGEKWPHSRGNVGKYSLHGSYGNIWESTKWNHYSYVTIDGYFGSTKLEPKHIAKDAVDNGSKLGYLLSTIYQSYIVFPIKHMICVFKSINGKEKMIGCLPIRQLMHHWICHTTGREGSHILESFDPHLTLLLLHCYKMGQKKPFKERPFEGVTVFHPMKITCFSGPTNCNFPPQSSEIKVPNFKKLHRGYSN